MKPSTALERLAAVFRDRKGEALPWGWSDDEWLAVITLANRHRLVPALSRALARYEPPGAVSDEVREYVSLISGLNTERNAALRQEIRRAVFVLNEAGLEPMLLKGAAALVDDRSPANDRMVGDIDLLLPDPAGVGALKALGDAGFRLVRTYPASAHAIADLEYPGSRACIDLHSGPLDPPFEGLLSAADLFKNAERPAGDGPSFLLPCHCDRVRHELVHAQILEENYYCRRLCLRAASEIARLAHTVDWGKIECWAGSHRLQAVLEAMLLSAEDVFGMAWPLSKPPSLTAVWHHRRACATEIGGCWDIGLSATDRLCEAFAPDRLAVLFGVDGWYWVKVARQCRSLLGRHDAGVLLQRLLARDADPARRAGGGKHSHILQR